MTTKRNGGSNTSSASASNDPFPPLGDNNSSSVDEQLASLSKLEDGQLKEATSGYKKWHEGETMNAKFEGFSEVTFDETDGPVKCAVLVDDKGMKHLAAQTIIVTKMQEIWDKKREVPFVVRINYEGKKGQGANKYDSFRILTL